MRTPSRVQIMWARYLLYVVRCAIWYHLYNLKNVKNTHGGVLTLLLGYFSRFLNCTNGTKSHNASHIRSKSILCCILSQLFVIVSPINMKNYNEFSQITKNEFYIRSFCTVENIYRINQIYIQGIKCCCIFISRIKPHFCVKFTQR